MTAVRTLRHAFALVSVAGLLAAGPVNAGESYAKRFPAQWLENDGRIRLDTICYNYPRQSHMYPLCRLQALTRLEERCQRYRTSLEQAQEAALHQHFGALVDKYCHASEDYRDLLTQQGFLQ